MMGPPSHNYRDGPLRGGEDQRPVLVERRMLCFRHSGLESDRRFAAECGMASGGIVESVDVTANGILGVSLGLKTGSPRQL
jgi:hypothetical protein